jgi:hypothetical protein
LTLAPFFTFYGGKYRAAPHYPKPQYDTIVEPFAGSAGYAMRYPDRKVTLVERDPVIAGTWRYLLGAEPEDVLRLPDLAPGQSVDDLSLRQEERWLIGWWLNKGTASPCKTPGKWMRDVYAGVYGDKTDRFLWGPRVRERIARQMPAIRHWKLLEGDYSTAPDVEATWFIDPPYAGAGKHYRFGSATLDYVALAAWCRTRQGQVTVCENDGADWLPFQHFRDIKASEAKQGGKVSREAIWQKAPKAFPREVAVVAGIRVLVFYAASAPPHVHLSKDDMDAAANIVDPWLPEIAFDAGDRQEILAWITQNSEALLVAWERARRGENPGRIP